MWLKSTWSLKNDQILTNFELNFARQSTNRDSCVIFRPIIGQRTGEDDNKKNHKTKKIFNDR